MKKRKNSIIIKYILAIVIVAAAVGSVFAFAPETTANAAAGAGDKTVQFQTIMGYTLLGLGGLVILVAAFSLYRISETLAKNVERSILLQQGIDPDEALNAKKGTPKYKSWRGFMQSMTKAVPVSQEEDVMLDHDYDGIHELDNRLPPWWVGMFYVTITFAIIHLLWFYVFNWGDSSKERYQKQVEKGEEAKQAYLEKMAMAMNENNVVALKDEAEIAAGKTIFEGNCAACHGTKGGGGVGPNLTDEYWLHGGGVKNVFKTIKYGVPSKGMISWQNQLSPPQMQQLASYILTLQGTKPANAKAPQGEIYVETAASGDSTSVAPENPKKIQ